MISYYYSPINIIYGTMEILTIILVFDIKTYGVSLISKHHCVEINQISVNIRHLSRILTDNNGGFYCDIDIRPLSEHLISPRRGFTFTSCHGFAVPILSVPGLFYMDADFGLFAWLSLA